MSHQCPAHKMIYEVSGFNAVVRVKSQIIMGNE
jgi:hypothetical protein